MSFCANHVRSGNLKNIKSIMKLMYQFFINHWTGKINWLLCGRLSFTLQTIFYFFPRYQAIFQSIVWTLSTVFLIYHLAHTRQEISLFGALEMISTFIIFFVHKIQDISTINAEKCNFSPLLPVKMLSAPFRMVLHLCNYANFLLSFSSSCRNAKS